MSTFENVRLASDVCVCMCVGVWVNTKDVSQYTTHHTLATVSGGPLIPKSTIGSIVPLPPAPSHITRDAIRPSIPWRPRRPLLTLRASDTLPGRRA